MMSSVTIAHESAEHDSEQQPREGGDCKSGSDSEGVKSARFSGTANSPSSTTFLLRSMQYLYTIETWETKEDGWN